MYNDPFAVINKTAVVSIRFTFTYSDYLGMYLWMGLLLDLSAKDGHIGVFFNLCYRLTRIIRQ